MSLFNNNGRSNNKIALSVESIFTPMTNSADPFNDPFAYSEEEMTAFNNEYEKRNPNPYHATVRKVQAAMEGYLGSNVAVFGDDGFHTIMRNPKARESYIKMIGKECFAGNEHMRNVFTTVMNNSVRAIQHQNGTASMMRSIEGYDATAIHSHRSNFNGCLAFTLVGYFARSKALEIFHPVENGQYPECDIEYYLSYAIHPATGKLLPLPQAQRTGDIHGAFDLPTICPKYSVDTPHVIDPSERGDGNNFEGKEAFKGQVGLVKFGYKGNCIIESGFDVKTDPLNDNVTMTEIWYRAGYEESSLTTATPKPIYKCKKVRIRAGVTQGEQRLRVFSGSVILETTKLGGQANSWTQEKVVVEELITGRINLDTGDYTISVTSNGRYSEDIFADHSQADFRNDIEVASFAYKLDAKILDAANLRGGLRFSRFRVHETLRTEYSCMGTIAISPYINDEWNLGGNQQVGYIAVMTDEMSKQYAITRDLKAEHFLMDQFECTSDMYIGTRKFGSFVRFAHHDMSDVGALGGTDPFEITKKALKLKITNIFSQAETHLNCPGAEDPQRAIPRTWVGIGPEQQIAAFPDLVFETVDMTNGEQLSNSATQKYGFTIGGAASFRDNLNRHTRIIGEKDPRWLNRDIMFFMKSTNPEFPTLMYYAFMYRIFSGIDPIYTNLPSLLFYGRDNVFCITQAMVKLAIINQDENTYSRMNNNARTRREITAWPNVKQPNVGNTILAGEQAVSDKIAQFRELMIANKLADDATPLEPKSL